MKTSSVDIIPSLIFTLILVTSTVSAIRSSKISSMLLGESNPPALGKSLLDLVTNGQVSGGAAASPASSVLSALSGGGEKDKLSIIDMAQTFLQKGDMNNLYIKLFKIFLNLFMDVMMDRMIGSKRREDVFPALLEHTSFQPYVVQRPSAVSTQRSFRSSFKPYFIN